MAGHAVFHRLPVADIEWLTDDAVAITFDVPSHLADDYVFEPGQHLSIRAPQLGDDVRRNYSICAPVGSGRLRIGVKRLLGGAFSEYALTTLVRGDELEVMTPSGRFTPRLDPAQARHYAMLVAGSGITPVLSIAASVLAVEPASRVTLVCANQRAASVMFLEELADLKDRYSDRFHLIHLLTQEPAEVELFSGRLDGSRLGRIIDALLPVELVDQWYLCGPYAMVVDLRETLEAHGVDPTHVHSELFHVESTPPARVVAPEADDSFAPAVSFLLDGRRSTVRVPRDGVPVLEAALMVRADAPYACKGGVCGTCRAKVLAGTVRMDTNYALEPEELEHGYVLTCQSHPTSDEVLLDYDA
ncbi:MAG: phenylacetate-CoA oxygenase/reductase subunit PaaK [Actinomycetota bacterium]|nr:phenylacetate-CoA oxygenase/reductase subunit PaaK [Actinomycetota bacterium]